MARVRATAARPGDAGPTGNGRAPSSNGRRPTSPVQALARSNLLPGVPAAAYRTVQDEVGIIRLDPGDVLIERGDVSKHLYLVVAGLLEVVLEGDAGTQHVAELTAGEIAGEIGLLAGEERLATVRAVDAVGGRVPDRRGLPPPRRGAPGRRPRSSLAGRTSGCDARS